MTVVLWHIEVSHYNEKARWALDYKSVPHELRVPMPGFHGVRAFVLTRGAQRRLPVMELEGRRIGDSTAIIAALEAYRPEPALYPADPAERRRALELEDFFDERLAPELRRLVWHHTLPDTDAVIDSLFADRAPGRARFLRATAPLARPVVRRDYGVSAAAAETARESVLAAMDRLEAEIQPSGYLAGDGFSVADLTAASLFYPAVLPPEFPYPLVGEVPERGRDFIA
ncbi:MAG: glutathione S-transferase, partial [Conexibacter sp.]|nr:glutathione S-transferase [Conexibacter sp.]